jgi:hypothetical protein
LPGLLGVPFLVGRWDTDDVVDGSRSLLPDARRSERFLRVTWHPEVHQFVVSTWVGETCVSTVRLLADTAAELMQQLADGLSASGAPGAVPPVSSGA